jgi:exonuclease SbcC
MRPLALTIEGLTSFRTKQDIDFSELDLFVITGPTGAGKTTVLDAITFALYGSVARVNGHELRDLISHGSSYMRVCLDFEVDGQHYRVARRMGMNSHQAALERIVNGSSTTEVEQGGIRAVNSRLEELVGLDFKTFTKAVLLPQGAFHEFLKGKVDERRRILVRLLDLGRYEAARQVASREAMRLDAIIDERASLIESTYQDATKERLRNLERTVLAVRKQHAKVERAKKDARTAVATAAEAHRKLETLTGGMSRLDDCVTELRRLEGVWPPLGAEEHVRQEELARTEKELADASKALELASKTLGATTKKTGDAPLLAILEAAAVTYGREEAEVSRLDIELAEAKKTSAELAKALKVAERDALKAKKELDARSKVRTEAEEQRKLAEVIVRCATSEAKLAQFDEELVKADKDAANGTVRANEARKRLKHLEQQHAAAALRAGLSPGDQCPVCDSIIEALPRRDDDIESVLTQAREAVEEAEPLEQVAKEVVVALKARRRDAAAERRRARAGLPDDAEVPELAKAEVALARTERALEEALAAESAAQAAVDVASDGVAASKTAAATARATAEGIATNQQGARKRHRAALSTLTTNLGTRLPHDLMAEITRRRDELARDEETHRTAAATVEGARQAREEARQLQSTHSARLSTFDQESATGRTAARMACELLARMLENQSIPAFPAEEGDRAQLLAAWLTCCDRFLAGARKAVSQLSKELEQSAVKLKAIATKAGVEVTSEDPADISADLEDAVSAAHGNVVAAEKDVETLAARIAEREKLEQDLVDDRRLFFLYRALATELRADRFIAFVLEESMNQLALQASQELLRISDGRYSLVADEVSFEVIDHHNADERRSVATLSGGETFLASLSLALALSAGLSELAGTAASRLEAIFIDEGFGALDPETLSVVVDALERLREGDRMVGVITHVPTLAERIPSGLLVEKNGSSRILAR